VEPASVQGNIVFEKVSFTPPGAARKVLDELELQVPAGAIVGLCGNTGCGKSTVLRMLLRLDDPDGGRILLDGTDLRLIDPALLPRIFGVLGQSSRLFERTLSHNLGLGLREKPSDQTLAAALKRVRLDELAAPESSGGRSLGMIYRAQPPNLSGGEQRRVLLARMLVRDARVFVLDEPEAGLPSALAEELLKSVGDVASGRTCLVVTHAPHVLDSTFNVVMDAGKVAARGTHAELLASSEEYRSLLAQALKPAQAP
jgi:ABC-type bacteriocin/lantibiotic exporter with double-glycine peptidase domain